MTKPDRPLIPAICPWTGNPCDCKNALRLARMNAVKGNDVSQEAVNKRALIIESAKIYAANTAQLEGVTLPPEIKEKAESTLDGYNASLADFIQNWQNEADINTNRIGLSRSACTRRQADGRPVEEHISPPATQQKLYD